MDDKKATHVNPRVVLKLLKQIGIFFGDIKVTKGKKHFLGVNISIKAERKTNIDIRDKFL